MISFKVWLAIAPFQAIIIYCIYKDLKTLINEIKRVEKAKVNLLNETIDIYMNEEESEMLEELARLRYRGNERRYLRMMIKEECENERVSGNVEHDEVGV